MAENQQYNYSSNQQNYYQYPQSKQLSNNPAPSNGSNQILSPRQVPQQNFYPSQLQNSQPPKNTVNSFVNGNNTPSSANSRMPSATLGQFNSSLQRSPEKFNDSAANPNSLANLMSSTPNLHKYDNHQEAPLEKSLQNLNLNKESHANYPGVPTVKSVPNFMQNPVPNNNHSINANIQSPTQTQSIPTVSSVPPSTQQWYPPTSVPKNIYGANQPPPQQQLQQQQQPIPQQNYYQKSNLQYQNIVQQPLPTYPRESVVRSGFNSLWGNETVDLMQNRHVLPATKVLPPPIKLNHQFHEAVNCSSE